MNLIFRMILVFASAYLGRKAPMDPAALHRSAQ
jgi:hypothetical protein